MKYSSVQSGFSLVETLVSITILLIVITGPMTIASSAARSTSFSSEQIIAFFLAQEGLEIAQMARDNLLLLGFDGSVADPWGEFINESGDYEFCFSSTGCGLELELTGSVTGSIKSPILSCSSTSCRLSLSHNKQYSRYTYVGTASDITPYTRTIYFDTIDGNQVHVTSKVTWRTGSQRDFQEVLVETYLFDVYEI